MGTTLESLKPPAGARRRKKRVGRGIGSGRGKTSTRGQKGYLARHNSMPVRFEGGQMPIHMRVPKRGFINIHRVEVHGVNVERLEGAFEAGAVVDPAALLARGLVPKKARVIKLLGGGSLTTALTVRVHRISASAREKVTAAGGTVELLGQAAAGAGAASDAGAEAAPETSGGEAG